jgi:hypothetical protein
MGQEEGQVEDARGRRGDEGVGILELSTRLTVEGPASKGDPGHILHA